MTNYYEITDKNGKLLKEPSARYLKWLRRFKGYRYMEAVADDEKARHAQTLFDRNKSMAEVAKLRTEMSLMTPLPKHDPDLNSGPSKAKPLQIVAPPKPKTPAPTKRTKKPGAPTLGPAGLGDTPETFKLTPEEQKAVDTINSDKRSLPFVGKTLDGIRGRFPALGVSDVKVKKVARGWQMFGGVKVPEAIIVSFKPGRKRKYQGKHDISVWVEAKNGWQKVARGYVVKKIPMYWSQPDIGWKCRVPNHLLSNKIRVGVRSVYDLDQLWRTGGNKWSDIIYSEPFTMAELFD